MNDERRIVLPDPTSPLLDDVAYRVKESFARQGFMHYLGAELIDVRAGQVTIRLANRPQVSQQHGFVHAGATAAVVDSAGGYAALTMMDADSEVLTVEYKLNLLAPAVGERLEAVGTVVRPGRTLTVCRLDVWAIDGETRTLIATGQQTVLRIANEKVPLAP